MGFIRRQEENLAMRYLLWQYQKKQISPPSSQDLERQTSQIVDDAHRIARETGSNIFSIIKELVQDIKKK